MSRDSFFEQQALLQAVLGTGDTAALSQCWPEGGEVRYRLWQRGLQAYRANGHALAERALAAVYPVLAELIGQENFSALTRHFWTEHPPLRGDMACWGDALAAFVDAASQLAGEPYLGDVARLEWLIHLAASAEDVEADLPSFALLASGDAAPVTLVLGAGVALLASPYPVASIVNAHLLGQPTLLQAGQLLQEGCAEHALVWRQGFRPRMRSSTAVEYQLLQGLVAGEPLLDALEALSLSEGNDAPAFDFNTWLGEAVKAGLVCAARQVPTTKAKGQK
jgi:hypothetical protein